VTTVPREDLLAGEIKEGGGGDAIGL